MPNFLTLNVLHSPQKENIYNKDRHTKWYFKFKYKICFHFIGTPTFQITDKSHDKINNLIIYFIFIHFLLRSVQQSYDAKWVVKSVIITFGF